MKTIYFYLSDYIKINFNWKLYTATGLFLAFFLVFNFRFDFEDSVIDSYYGSNLRVLWFLLYQGLPYYICCFFIYHFTSHKAFIRQKGFWAVSAAGMFILAVYRGGYYNLVFTDAFSPDPLTYNFIHKVSDHLISLAVVIIPMVLLYLLVQRRQLSHFYGLQTQGIKLKPYFILLVLMAPLIAWASFQPDFLRVYPFYRRAGIGDFAAFMKISEPAAISFFEFSYALSFFTVELFFRGFLIFGLTKYLGKNVVLPMAVTYCVLHFGKPVGEAVSSFFGGYILGVLALQTQNIYVE